LVCRISASLDRGACSFAIRQYDCRTGQPDVRWAGRPYAVEVQKRSGSILTFNSAYRHLTEALARVEGEAQGDCGLSGRGFGEACGMGTSQPGWPDPLPPRNANWAEEEAAAAAPHPDFECVSDRAVAGLVAIGEGPSARLQLCAASALFALSHFPGNRGALAPSWDTLQELAGSPLEETAHLATGACANLLVDASADAPLAEM
jgi:hypothetical protein